MHAKGFSGEVALETIKRILAAAERKLEVRLVLFKVKMLHFKKDGNVLLERRQWLELYEDLCSLFQLYQDELPFLGEVHTFLTASEGESEFYEQEVLVDILRLYFVQLQDQLRKALIYTEFSSSEYAKRLTDLINMIELNYRLLLFSQERQAAATELQLALLLVENVHFMNKETVSSIAERLPAAARTFIRVVDKDVLFAESKGLMRRIKDEPTRVRLALVVAFFLSLSGEFEKAQVNLLSCLGRQDVINSDEYLQVLANRAMTQLGIEAFRRGQYATASYYLAELCGSGKLRDLLSQGSRQVDGRLRKRLVPYYMYLPVETVECLELLCAMVLQSGEDAQRHKSLARMYEHYEHNYFIASPINPKDLLYSACKELQAGNWRGCYEFVGRLLIWEKFQHQQQTLSLLRQAIKLKALENYLALHMENFTSIALSKLGLSFELEEQEVRQVVSHGILVGSLKGVLEGEYLLLTTKVSPLLKELSALSTTLLDASLED